MIPELRPLPRDYGRGMQAGLVLVVITLVLLVAASYAKARGNCDRLGGVLVRGALSWQCVRRPQP